MRRRQLLQRAGGLGAITVFGSTAVSGRYGSDSDGGGWWGGGSGGDSAGGGWWDPGPGDGSDGGTGDGATSYIGSKRFEIIESGSSVRDTGSEVSISDDGTEVTVRATVSVSNGCETVELDGVTYDPDTQELTVATETVNPQEGAMVYCPQVIVFFTYEVTVSMQRGSVESVIVTHDGSDVGAATG